jgi:hypothetical protein
LAKWFYEGTEDNEALRLEKIGCWMLKGENLIEKEIVMALLH